jgi:hypothetical protein
VPADLDRSGGAFPSFPRLMAPLPNVNPLSTLELRPCAFHRSWWMLAPMAVSLPSKQPVAP